MVQAQIDISEHTNRILNIVKAKYGLPDKSAAIDVVASRFEEDLLEPELRPEFIGRMRRVLREKPIPVKDFAKRYGVKRVRA